MYWGHFNRNTEIEALIPYHYCHEHRDRVPDASRDDVMWHLESKQITRNRRGEASGKDGALGFLDNLAGVLVCGQGSVSRDVIQRTARACSGAAPPSIHGL